MAEAATVRVIGSLNVDLVMHTDRLPRPGETITGATFHIAAGGKGANQAVAAARLGARVAMIGRIGADSFGQVVRDELAAAGVDTSHVSVDSHAPTGTAQIVVDAAGQNAIVVASGANHRLPASEVGNASDAWRHAALIVLQLEVPLATVTAAVTVARARGVPVLLNAAPARPLPDDFLAVVDWLVVNEIEAEQLLAAKGSGTPIRTPADALAAAAALQQPGQHVVVTLGALGAVVVGPGRSLQIAAPVVEAIDTTAAGDALVGALASALRERRSPEEALLQGVLAGSFACTRIGAIPSLPTAAELHAFRCQCSGRGNNRANLQR